MTRSRCWIASSGNISRRDDVIDAVRESFDDDIWVERNMFSLNDVQKYVVSWNRFCHAVKRERLDPAQAEPDEDEHDIIPVSSMLDTLKDMVHESGLIRTLPGDRILSGRATCLTILTLFFGVFRRPNSRGIRNRRI
jgi:HEPN/RES N-terminal domain 1